MKSAEAYVEVIKGHRITIPKTVRKLLDLEVGDMIKITVEKVEGGEEK